MASNGKPKKIMRKPEAGQVLPFVTFGLLAFVTAAGLAIDMGYLRYERRLMQAAADAAAVVAATDLNLGNAAQENTDALLVAQLNGFQDGVNNTTVTVGAPTTPPVTNPGSAVQVQVQRILPSMFMKVIGVNSSTMQATAVASISTSTGCLYALQAGGITVNGDLSAPNCGIVDNGDLNGTGNITAESVGVLGSSGGYSGVSTPAVDTIAQGAADPLAYLVAPAVGGCTVTNFTWTVGVTTLAPGVYCGGMIISGGAVTLNSGLYILTGANGLQVSGTGSITDAGSGVTIYNQGSGAFNFSGTGNVALTAPAAGFSGLPAGLLLYQDPGDATAADLSMAGTGNAVLNGALYFPTADLTVSGSLNPAMNTVIVAGSITINGPVVLNADSTSVSGGSPLLSVSLVQ